MESVYKKLIGRIQRLEKVGERQEDKFMQYRQKFLNAINSDLNTSMAITVLYDLLKDSEVNDATKRALIESFDTVLSLNLLQEAKEEKVDGELAKYVEALLAERKQAKKEKNFARADEIRDELKAKGIIIKDTREGTIWSLQG